MNAKRIKPPTQPRDGLLFEDQDDDPPSGELSPAVDDPEYIIDPADGMLAEVLKPHSSDKHLLIQHYVDICRGTRRQWVETWSTSATYIDLYCGPGRACTKEGKEFRDVGPLLAWHTATHPSTPPRAPFTAMYIGDARRDLVEAAHQRLVAQEAPVTKFVGEAEVTVDEAIRSLGPGLHLAILDPFGIKALPFSVVTKLAKVETLDLIIHVSRLGLSRNLGFNVQRKQNAFDRFWPDWRSVYDADQSDPTNLYAIFSGWAAAVAGLGKPVRGTEAIAANGRTLYWLVLVSGHPLAGTFWSKITALHPQRPLLPN